jgi:hypothetical protein
MSTQVITVPSNKHAAKLTHCNPFVMEVLLSLTLFPRAPAPMGGMAPSIFLFMGIRISREK